MTLTSHTQSPAALQPQGLTVSSRGLSEAQPSDTSGNCVQKTRTPKGCK
jgi:hypothetical protein